MVAAEAVDLVEVEEEVVAVVDSEAEEVDLEVEAARVETAKEGAEVATLAAGRWEVDQWEDMEVVALVVEEVVVVAVEGEEALEAVAEAAVSEEVAAEEWEAAEDMEEEIMITLEVEETAMTTVMITLEEWDKTFPRIILVVWVRCLETKEIYPQPKSPFQRTLQEL